MTRPTKCTNCLRAPCECEYTAWAVRTHLGWYGRRRPESEWDDRYLWQERDVAHAASVHARGRLVRIRRKVKQ
jgi:hypothetical protein